MLKIYRYLALASAVLLFLALVLIAWFYNQQATRDLVEMTTKHNIAVDRILSNAIWSRHKTYLSASTNMDGDMLRSQPETAEIAEKIGQVLRQAGLRADVLQYALAVWAVTSVNYKKLSNLPPGTRIPVGDFDYLQALNAN